MGVLFLLLYSFLSYVFRIHHQSRITKMPPTFTNPILTGFNPDPSIVRVGSDFFLVTSSFEYFPGLPIYHSKNLLDWKLIGHALTRSSQLNLRTVEPGAGVWAPTLRYRADGSKNGKGRWYLACCTWFRYRPLTNVSCATQCAIEPQ